MKHRWAKGTVVWLAGGTLLSTLACSDLPEAVAVGGTTGENATSSTTANDVGSTGTTEPTTTGIDSTAGSSSSGDPSNTGTDTDTDAETETDTGSTGTEPGCGDGIIEGDEACDDGAANSDETPNACRTDCQLASCGDGVVDAREGCDDGEANDNGDPDACRTNCAPASCGDGVVDTGEACDNGATNSDAAPNACRTTCVEASCSDGVIDTGEVCDDGAANSDVQPDACRSSCMPAACGDNVVDSAEGCDDGNLVTEVCDYDTGSCTVCDATCAEVAGAESFCGDGTTNGPEACDDGAGNSDTTPDACRVGCVLAACGDAVVDSAEGCDDGNTANADGCEGDCHFVCEEPNALLSGAEAVYSDGAGCYFHHTAQADWVSARDTCASASGDLVTINNQAENDFVVDFGALGWLGYNDRAVEGDFEWVFPDSNFENWNAGEPNNTGPTGEDCVTLRGDGLWNDADCTATREFVCEQHTCGDGNTDPGEDCDDMNSVTEVCDYSETTCTVCDAACLLVPGATSFCGDGIVDAANSETCDDGNAANNDGCTACAEDSGYTCFGTAASVCLEDPLTITTVSMNLEFPTAYDGTLGSMDCLDIVVASAGDDTLDGMLVEVAATAGYIGGVVFKLVNPGGTVTTLMSLPGLAEAGDTGECCGHDGQLVPASPIRFFDAASTSAESMGQFVSGSVAICGSDGVCDFSPNAGAATPGTLTDLNGGPVAGTWQLCGATTNELIQGSFSSVTLTMSE